MKTIGIHAHSFCRGETMHPHWALKKVSISWSNTRASCTRCGYLTAQRPCSFLLLTVQQIHSMTHQPTLDPSLRSIWFISLKISHTEILSLFKLKAALFNSSFRHLCLGCRCHLWIRSCRPIHLIRHWSTVIIHPLWLIRVPPKPKLKNTPSHQRTWIGPNSPICALWSHFSQDIFPTPTKRKDLSPVEQNTKASSLFRVTKMNSQTYSFMHVLIIWTQSVLFNLHIRSNLTLKFLRGWSLAFLSHQKDRLYMQMTTISTSVVNFKSHKTRCNSELSQKSWALWCRTNSDAVLFGNICTVSCLIRQMTIPCK